MGLNRIIRKSRLRQQLSGIGAALGLVPMEPAIGKASDPLDYVQQRSSSRSDLNAKSETIT
ncbi:MAG: hypothetical protein ABL921_24660 [Pirellula sp.]